MTVPTSSSNSTNLTAVADTDGDAATLSDVIGGSGARDPTEASEGEEQLTNVGGKGEDLRPLTALHSGNVAALTQQQVAPAAGGLVIATILTAGAGGLANGLGTVVGLVGSYFALRHEASSLSAQYNQGQIQQDPFDPGYKQIYSPVFLPPTSGMPALPASLPAAEATALQNDLTASLTATGNVASYSQAVYVTQNRLFSAYQSGDLNSFDSQNTALNKYVAALATSEIAEGQADTALANELTADGGDAAISPVSVTSFQSSLKAQGFAALPAQEQSIIGTYLPNAADKQALVNQLLQVDPNTVPTSFIAQLQNEATNADMIGRALTIPPPTNTTVPSLKLNFSVVDLTTGQLLVTSEANGTSLPDGGKLFTDITTDSLSITSNVPNAFIVSGTGNDIISAQAGGDNVLDDTGGAVNFEIGGPGKDAFFLDASKDPVSWNTIASFHAGDFAVIYGVNSQDVAVNAANDLGVPAYSGLTLETYQNGGAAFITFAGHNKSELGSSLATAFGADPSGRSFMLVAGT